MTNPFTQRALDAEAAFHQLCDNPHARPGAATAAFEALSEAEALERAHTTEQLRGRRVTVSAVEAVLARIDPVNILTPANADEYESIAEDLTVNLDQCGSASDVTDVARRVVGRWFWDPAPGDAADYEIIGFLVWNIVMREGEHAQRA